MLISERFTELRKKSGFTQKQMADYLGVDQSYVSKFEKNERQFSSDMLEKSVTLFGCSMKDFMNESCELTQLPTAFRTKNLNEEDLVTLATINKIALNLREMEAMLEEEES